MKSVDGNLDANLTEFGVASDSPLAIALKSNVEAREPAARAISGPTTQHAESVSDMKSKLFHMEAAGFKDGAFCKKKGADDSHHYEIVAITAAGMEISKWTWRPRNRVRVDRCQ